MAANDMANFMSKYETNDIPRLVAAFCKVDKALVDDNVSSNEGKRVVLGVSHESDPQACG